MLCHEASKSLCPSNKLAMPAFPLQGSSFRKGVRFSVQTTSRGRVPCSRYDLSGGILRRWLAGSKVILGLVVRVESMKLSEAQNKPDKALFKVTHLANDLYRSQLWRYHCTVHLYSSSESASIQAHSSTPVPPSFLPPHGLEPQLLSSHLPVLNLRWSSLVFACCRICPRDRGMYLKCCCSYDRKEALLRKLKDARRDAGVRGWRLSRSL